MIELLNMDCMDYLKECKDNEFDLAVVDGTISTFNLRIY